jgi:D-alanyl-D-alanine carboxypeptidase
MLKVKQMKKNQDNGYGIIPKPRRGIGIFGGALIGVTIIIASLTVLLSCQEKPAPQEIRLQHILDSIYQEHPNGVGFILHVAAPDQNISWGGAVGYSNRDTKQPLSKDQPGQIASITKTFTAAAIFRLIEQGKMELHQPIKTLLPERTAILLEDNGYNLDSITIAHLLSWLTIDLNFR